MGTSLRPILKNLSNQNTELCVEWPYNHHKRGYGLLAYKGQRKMVAHRVAWQLANGDLPNNICVLHKCDNPPCVNLKHLFLGTQADNMQDKKAKGRSLARRNHCKYGHLLDGITFRWNTIHSYRYTTRYCKTCNNKNSRRLNGQITTI